MVNKANVLNPALPCQKCSAVSRITDVKGEAHVVEGKASSRYEAVAEAIKRKVATSRRTDSPAVLMHAQGMRNTELEHR
jgi:hypothetical protein